MWLLVAFVLALALLGPMFSAAILRRLAALLAVLIVIIGALVSARTSFDGAHMFAGFALTAGCVWAVLRGVAWVVDGA